MSGFSTLFALVTGGVLQLQFPYKDFTDKLRNMKIKKHHYKYIRLDCP